MDGGTVIGILVVLVVLVVLFVWQFGATEKALVTTTIQSRRSPEENFGIIQEAFSGARCALWTGATRPSRVRATVGRRRSQNCWEREREAGRGARTPSNEPRHDSE
jgi:hypothetical protein